MAAEEGAMPTFRDEPFKEHVVRLMKKIETIPQSSMEVFLWDLIHLSIGDIREYSYHTLSLKNRSETRRNLGIKIIADIEDKTLFIVDNGFGRNVIGLMSEIHHLEDVDVKLYEDKIDECLMSGDPSAYYQIEGICLGVYASFMVANKVVITTKPADDDHVYMWESQGLLLDDDGSGSGSRSASYSITYAPPLNLFKAAGIPRGTIVALHLKPEHVDTYLDFDRLKTLVSNLNSDRCAYPIQVCMLPPVGAGKSELLRFLDTKEDIATLKKKFEPLRRECWKMLKGWVEEVVIDDSVYDLPVALSLETKRFEINPRHHSMKKLLKEYSEDPDGEAFRVHHIFQLHFHKLLASITMRDPIGYVRPGYGCGTSSS